MNNWFRLLGGHVPYDRHPERSRAVEGQYIQSSAGPNVFTFSAENSAARVASAFDLTRPTSVMRTEETMTPCHFLLDPEGEQQKRNQRLWPII